MPAAGTWDAHLPRAIAVEGLIVWTLRVRHARYAQTPQDGMVCQSLQNPRATCGGSRLVDHREGLSGRICL